VRGDEKIMTVRTEFMYVFSLVATGLDEIAYIKNATRTLPR
jgi:hypothetical protein